MDTVNYVYIVASHQYNVPAAFNLQKSNLEYWTKTWCG